MVRAKGYKVPGPSYRRCATHYLVGVQERRAVQEMRTAGFYGGARTPPSWHVEKPATVSSKGELGHIAGHFAAAQLLLLKALALAAREQYAR